MFECTVSDDSGFRMIHIRGRIDGINSPEIERRFSELVLEGDRVIVADLSETGYISSAGLRVFLSAQKKLTKAGGEVILYKVPPAVADVFEMGGLTNLFRFFTEKDLLDPSFESEPSAARIEELSVGGMNVSIMRKGGGAGLFASIGDPGKMASSGYEESDVVSVAAKDIGFGTGLAAYGRRWEDYHEYFGEALVLNHHLFFYPAVKRPAVDFMLHNPADADLAYPFLYGFRFSGDWSFIAGFENPDGFVDIDGITEALFTLTGANLVGVVLLGESKGIWGMNLKRIPLLVNRPPDGRPISEPDHFREWMNYPVEPGDINHVVAAAGVVVRDKSRIGSDARGVFTGKSLHHFHGAVFDREPVNRNIMKFESELDRVLTDLSALRVQHLLGRSAFSSCTVGVIELEN